jgi:alkylation response protein AidB-like acyl-CoA dehydrogenase
VHHPVCAADFRVIELLMAASSKRLAARPSAGRHSVEKALEAAGGAGFYRKTGLERLLRDAHGAQFHPLAAKRQHRFTGRVLLGLDPISDV